MSKVALSGNVSGTGTFTLAAPNSNTDRTLTLPDEAGTVLTSASDITQKGVPAFSAYKNSTQSLTSSTWTKVTFQAEVFDTNSNFDTSTSRFQPSVAGYYQINCTGFLAVSPTVTYIQLYKNGSGFNVYSNLEGSSIAQVMLSINHLMYFNGSTDYIELFAYVNAGTAIVDSGSTWFQGVLVRAA